MSDHTFASGLYLVSDHSDFFGGQTFSRIRLLRRGVQVI
ncbi:hypothetical protein ACPOL_0852 [Acidisarcina polymorpha]|uniref:Uncharacterized protein n=1 Tax=Acidisarcina polymorpha TaxID=2211140 RepID=A0A2Z5FTP1_9BACT|nr:hypothetical protein ACPOL_0852 [Acidisarcina polymorpha]